MCAVNIHASSTKSKTHHALQWCLRRNRLNTVLQSVHVLVLASGAHTGAASAYNTLPALIRALLVLSSTYEGEGEDDRAEGHSEWAPRQAEFVCVPTCCCVCADVIVAEDSRALSQSTLSPPALFC